MELAVFWLIVGAIFGVVEGITVGLVSVWFVGGAIAAAVAASLGATLMVQTIVFLAVSLGLLLGTRPFLRKRFDKKVPKTNAETLVGSEAVVVTDIAPNAPGEVKVFGNIWRATADEPIPAGETVWIRDLNGVTVSVWKRNSMDRIGDNQ